MKVLKYLLIFLALYSQGVSKEISDPEITEKMVGLWHAKIFKYDEQWQFFDDSTYTRTIFQFGKVDYRELGEWSIKDQYLSRKIEDSFIAGREEPRKFRSAKISKVSEDSFSWEIPGDSDYRFERVLKGIHPEVMKIQGLEAMKAFFDSDGKESGQQQAVFGSVRVDGSVHEKLGIVYGRLGETNQMEFLGIDNLENEEFVQVSSQGVEDGEYRLLALVSANGNPTLAYRNGNFAFLDLTKYDLGFNVRENILTYIGAYSISTKKEDDQVTFSFGVDNMFDQDAGQLVAKSSVYSGLDVAIQVPGS